MRPYSFARALVDAGHEVTVLTAVKPLSKHDLSCPLADFEMIDIVPPLLPWLFQSFGVNQSRRDPQSHASQTSWLRNWLRRQRIERGVFFLGRMPDVLDLWIQPAVRAVSGRSFDVLLSTYAPYASHVIASRLVERGVAQHWVADFRDPWTRHHQFRGLFPFSMVERFLEQRTLRQANLVTTVSQGVADILKQDYPSLRVQIVPNGYDDSLLTSLDPTPLYEDGCERLVHTGTLYPGNRNHHVFLDALEYLRDHDASALASLAVVFAGADLAGLEFEVAERKLQDTVSFPGVVRREEALRMQRDACVQLFFETEAIEGVTTGKLYEYLASGRPIWRISQRADSDSARIIHDSATGINVPTEPVSLARMLAQVARQRPTLKPDPAQVARHARSSIAAELVQSLEQEFSNQRTC